MLHKDEIKILRTVKLAPLFVAIFSILYIFILYENNHIQFNEEVEQLKKQSILEMEHLIKSEVLRVYDFIKVEKSLSINKIKKNLQERVQEAHAIAMSIYRNNKHRSNSDIKRLISDALRDIRFNKGRGYFFVYDTAGTSVMHPILPHLENTNLWDFQDVKGRYVIQELSEIAKSRGEGILTWWWKKPTDTKTEYKKIGYSKYFAPFDWFIGTGDYIADYENELKKELLMNIKKIRFGKEGYLFIIDKQGQYLSHIGKKPIGLNKLTHQESKNLDLTKAILSVAQAGEGFLSYASSEKSSEDNPSRKRSFVKGFDDWQWAIGSGTYLNDIDKLVARKQTQLNMLNNEELMRSIIVSFIICCILLFGAFIFSNLIKNRFQQYKKKVSQNNITLHELNLSLEGQVQMRTAALECSNTELATTLTHLKSMQSKLIESEKMASMVGVVSGIAHELNTPLGIMVTATTLVDKEIQLFFEKLRTQQLTRKNLQQAEETWLLGYKLLYDNLQRSVQLVHNFKSLSTHNDADELHVFSMKPLLESLASVFKVRFDNAGVQYKVDIIGEFILTNYQSVLIDVLMQLIQNSLTHAFQATTVPSINIKVQRQDDMAEIIYFDNGTGSKNIDKIFELFYTTKRGSDCIGLGLPIVYNQVVHKLSGSIKCIPSEQKSLEFVIRIPLTLAKNEDVANIT